MAVVIESPLPAPPLPPPPPSISFEDQHNGLDDQQKRGKQVISTLSWLVARVSEQQSAFTKLEWEFRTFRKEADSKIWEAEQKEDLLEHRFELMEADLKKSSMFGSMNVVNNVQDMAASLRPVSRSITEDKVGESTNVPAEERVDSPPTDMQSTNLLQSGNLNLGESVSPSMGAQSMGAQSMGAQSMGAQSMGAESAMLQNSMTDLEAELRSVKFAMKKMDSHIKHAEQQQLQRDQAQDELQRMEFAKMNRDIEVCIKDKELESFRGIIMGKMGHIEAEAKADAERVGKALKENLSEKMMEVQSSLERISESADSQVRLVGEKIAANDAEDHEREKENLALFSDIRGKIAAVSQQVVLLADHVGADQDAMAQTGRDLAGSMGNGAAGLPPPERPATNGNRPVSQGASALAQRVDTIEKRLDSLDGGDGGVFPGPPQGGDITSAKGSPPGSRPSSRGREPLPARVEKLEDKHDDLVETLEETLGIQLATPPEPEEKSDSDRPDSRQGGRSGRRQGGDVGPDRLSALETQVNQLAAHVGVDVGVNRAAQAAADREPSPPPASAGSGGLELLNAKMDEVASALGLTPEELESFARSGNRGNLAGRVVLRDEATAVSPRMAGMIAGQEDRIGQLDGRMSEMLRDFDDKFLNIFDKHDLRIRNLEDQPGGKPQSPGKGTNLDNLEKRMQGIANEDLSDTGATGGVPAKAKPKAVPDGSAKAVAVEGGTGGSREINRENEEMLAAVMEEVRRLNDDASDIQARLRHLDNALEALRAGSPAPVVQAALGSPRERGDGGSAASRAASEAAKMSEAASQAAALSAEECQRLKEELAEIVNAVNVPSVNSLEDDSLFDTAKPVDGEDLDLDDEVRDDAARQYVERQTVMESRLKQLEDQIDSASVVMPESQIFTSLKYVIKDVRRCLSRCEMLYQLPEIKMFMKRFQRSLEVNAILHEKWLGPSAGRPQQSPSGDATRDTDRPQSAGGSQLSEEQMTRNSEMSRSVPDFRKVKGGKLGLGGKGQEGVKKKPFRTVVDWCRPHTPLKIDPVFKGHGPPAAGGSRGDERASPHLPQIK